MLDYLDVVLPDCLRQRVIQPCWMGFLARRRHAVIVKKLVDLYGDTLEIPSKHGSVR